MKMFKNLIFNLVYYTFQMPKNHDVLYIESLNQFWAHEDNTHVFPYYSKCYT